MEKNDAILNRLAEIVGKGNASSSPETIVEYSHDQSFARGSRPHYVVFPGSSKEIQEIIQYANEKKIPLVPRSSRVSLHGGCIPKEGGILVDLKRMDRVIEINERNWYAVIEPGVSFRKLNGELIKKGFHVAKPFLDPPSASVVSSYMERNPVITAADFTYGTEHVVTYTVVSPAGEPFTIGHPPLENTPASAPDGPGINFYKIFQGAQGTLGIVTWMIVRVLPLPKEQKIFFFPCESIERAIEVMARIQKSELGLECFALNDFNLAAMMVNYNEDETKALQEGDYIGIDGALSWDENQNAVFDDLQSKLPPWTVVVALSAVGPIPGEKISYQEQDLREVSIEIGAEPRPTVGGIANLDRIIQDELIMSWRMQKRFGFRGSCQQIMFSASPDSVDEFNDTVFDTAGEYGYPPEDIGIFLMPMERGRAFYLSYDFHCSRYDEDESELVRDLHDALSGLLVEQGAFFDRPYGKWAEMVYSRAGMYAEYLRKIKAELDPNNIMNPGKLCF